MQRMAKEKGRKRLGELLVEQGALREEDLKEALKEQANNNGFLGEILLRMGLVTEEDIVIALATQFNFPYLPIDNFEINPQAIKAVPADLVRQYLFIPIDTMNNILTVVMSDPTDEAAISAIEKTTGCRVQPFVSTAAEIKKAINRHYRLDLKVADSTAQNISKISFRRAKEKTSSGAKSG